MTDKSTADNPHEEPRYECMYCDSVNVGRAIKNHVLWESDDAHGPRGDIPDDYDLSECEPANESARNTTHTPSVAEHSRWICTYCGKLYRGKSGLGVHIARTNDGYHPADETGDVHYTDHTIFPANTAKIVWVPHEGFESAVQFTDQELEEGWVTKVNDHLAEKTGLDVIDDIQEFREHLREWREFDE